MFGASYDWNYWKQKQHFHSLAITRNKLHICTIEFRSTLVNYFLGADCPELTQNLSKVSRWWTWELHVLISVRVLEPTGRKGVKWIWCTCPSEIKLNSNETKPISGIKTLHPRVKAWRQGLCNVETTCERWPWLLEGVRARSRDSAMFFVPPYTSSPNSGIPKYFACARIYPRIVVTVWIHKHNSIT